MVRDFLEPSGGKKSAVHSGLRFVEALPSCSRLNTYGTHIRFLPGSCGARVSKSLKEPWPDGGDRCALSTCRGHLIRTGIAKNQASLEFQCLH